jgi:hypothetical protein
MGVITRLGNPGIKDHLAECPPLGFADRHRQSLWVIIGIRIPKRFPGSMEKVLPVEEGNRYWNLRRQNHLRLLK